MIRPFALALLLTGLLYWLLVAPITAAGQRTGYNPAAVLQAVR